MKQTVTPFDVKSNSPEGIDYSKLINDFGLEVIDRRFKIINNQ